MFRRAPARFTFFTMSSNELSERLALARLDGAAKEFSSAHRHLEALACMEKALVLRKRLFGVRSSEVRGCALPAMRA